MNLFAKFGLAASDEADTEVRLVSAAQRGNKEAYDSLIRMYERPLHGFLARRVGMSAADDVMQDTWIAAWQALPKFTKRGRFRAWLYGIAFHKSIDFHRSRARVPVEAPLEDTLPGPDVMDWSASAELRDNVLILVEALPEDQRDVLDLYYYGELTLAEVALQLQRNLNTVKSQFYRAHASIALQFEQIGSDKGASGLVLLNRGERSGR